MMDRRDFLRRAGMAVVAIMEAERPGLASGDEDKRQVSKPNILFIMFDDHTSQAFGVYGSRLARLNPTPNIDALAKNGMRCSRYQPGVVEARPGQGQTLVPDLSFQSTARQMQEAFAWDALWGAGQGRPNPASQHPI